MLGCILCHRETDSCCALCSSPLCEDHILPLSLHKQQCSSILLRRFTEAAVQKGIGDRASSMYHDLHNLYTEWEQAATRVMQADASLTKIDALLQALCLSNTLFGSDHPVPQETLVRLLFLLSEGYVDTKVVTEVLDSLVEYPLKMTSKVRYLYNFLILSSGCMLSNLKVIGSDRYLTIKRNINQAIFLLLNGERYSAQALLKDLFHSDRSPIEAVVLRYVWHCAQTSSKDRQTTLFLVTETELEQSFPKQCEDGHVTIFFIQVLLYFTHYNNLSAYSSQTVHDKMMLAKSMLRDTLYMLQGVSTLSTNMLAALYIRILAVLVETSSLSSLIYEYGKEASRIFTQFLLASKESSALEQAVEEPADSSERELIMDDLDMTSSVLKKIHHRLCFFPSESSPPMLITTVPNNPYLQAELAFNVTRTLKSIHASVFKRQKERSLARRVASSFADQRILPLHYKSPKVKSISQHQSAVTPTINLQKGGANCEMFNGSSSRGRMEANLRVREVLADMRQAYRERTKACNLVEKMTLVSKDIDLDFLEHKLYSSKVESFIKNPGNQYIAALTKEVLLPYSKQSLCKFSKELAYSRETGNPGELISRSLCSVDRSSPKSKSAFSEQSKTMKDSTWIAEVDRLLATTTDVINELNAYEFGELKSDCA
ncbi:Hypothetical protein GLP15_1082 [Giardia lamblia P15]|uniref:Uncharacterized protein n=1 Tax=Giardia intestinalis (strain P15) TaxID=658858 RepID=E1F2L8_GIAIA|nr:Hypothetical protein GLP15_1082 [Giardia lamblia P15]